MDGQAGGAHIEQREADLRRVADVARVLHVVDVVERHVEAPHLERELPPHPLGVAVEATDALEALQPPIRVARRARQRGGGVGEVAALGVAALLVVARHVPEPLALLLLEVAPAIDAAAIVTPVRVVAIDEDARVRALRLHLARERDVVGDA